MREDFDYVDKATAICLSVTDKGSKHLREFLDTTDYFRISSDDNPLEDMLAFIEDAYICVDDTSCIDVDKMFDALVKTYRESYNSVAPDENLWRRIFHTAVCEGLVGIRKVIWG